MDTVTTVFLAMGIIGAVTLVVSAMLGDILPFDLGAGVFSLPVVAGFVSAMGFGGLIGAHITPGTDGIRIIVGIGVGLAVALPAAWLTFRLTMAVQHMPTDTTPRQSDYLGKTGTVVTGIKAGGTGEVRITISGQPVKLRARSTTALKTGTAIFVIDTESLTTVVVEPTSTFTSNPTD